MIKDRYLGDGVYASFDGYQIWLDTRAQVPVNRIALESQVLAALVNYAAAIRQAERAEAMSEGAEEAGT